MSGKKWLEFLPSRAGKGHIVRGSTILLIFLIVLLMGPMDLPVAQAQVDPSSAILIQKSGPMPNESSNVVESNRYRIGQPRKTEKRSQTQPAATRAKSSSKDENSNSPMATPKTPTEVEEEDDPIPRSSRQPGDTLLQKVELERRLEPPALLTTSDESDSNPSEAQPPKEGGNLTQDVKDYLLGGRKAIEFSSQLKRNDPKRNVVDLKVGTLLIYNDSASSYWYRRYSTFSPGLLLGLKFWLTPFFGIQTDYASSLSADINNSPTGISQAAVTHQWSSAGLLFRQVFGPSPRDPYLLFGIEFQDYQLLVPPNDGGRLKIRSTGPKFSVESYLPSTETEAWTVGFGLQPFQNHQEMPTGISVQSGSGVQSTGIAISGGRAYQFSRSHQLFWKLSHRLEKLHFGASANTPDPISQETPSGLSVINSFTLLEMGFQWGL